VGKRPEDLPLDPEPMRRKKPTDVRDTEWFQFKQRIDEMLSSGEYGWAEDTLSGIAESVERYQTVTPGQERAIENIYNAGQRTQRRGSRRYEGYKRWNR
jgi:hypothetical protein